GAGSKSRKATRQLIATDDFWDMLPEEELAKLLGWRILLGVGFAQLEWTDHGDRIVPRLTEWHPSHVKWDWNKRQWITRVDQGPDVVITPGDGQWVVCAAAGLRPWTSGVWRAVAAWCLLKQFAKSDWARYSERHGMGTFVATAADSTVPEHREALARELESIGRDAVIALPAGFDLKLVEATASTWTTYQAQIQAADNGIAIALTGQNLTSEVQGGSLAAAQVHARVALQFIKGDAGALSTCLHNQVLEPWAEFNIGDRNAAPWPKWDTTPPEDQAARANVLVQLSTAIQGMLAAGVPLDVAELAADFNVPPRTAEEVAEEGRQAHLYPLEYGIVTINEARERLGLPPIEGGDKPPEPRQAQDQEGAEDATEAASGDESGSDTRAQSSESRPQARAKKTSGANSARKPKPKAKLASGFYAQSSGFIAGQDYADKLAEKARERAAEAIKPFVDEVMRIVANAGSPAELRRALTLLADKVDQAGELDELTEKAVIMAQLAGRAAVLED